MTGELLKLLKMIRSSRMIATSFGLYKSLDVMEVFVLVITMDALVTAATIA